MNDLFTIHSVWLALNPDEAISKVIIWLMWLLFIAYVVYLSLYYRHTAKRRVQSLREQVASISEERLVAEPTALFDYKAQLRQYFSHSTDVALKKAWLSFDRSIISNKSQTQLYSTADSRYFFNENALAPWLSGNRLMVSVPSMLVAIGVLGTFIGLVVGLSGLDANASDTETLRTGIGTLISGASVAFTTSIWGVFLSLIAGLVERSYESAIKTRLAHLNTALAVLFPSISSEQALIHIEDASERATEALHTLHEKIGAELERSVQDLSTQMQQAIVSALEGVMQPAMDKLVDNSQQQSTEALEKLVKQFMGGMNQAGQSQTREMGQASERLDGSLDKLSQITKASSEQNQQMIAQHRELTQQFEHAVDSMRDSSRYLAATSTQLGGISRDLLAVSNEVRKRGALNVDRLAPKPAAAAKQPAKKSNPYA